MPNFLELLKESSMKHWTMIGPERLVKVVNPYNRDELRKYKSAFGYVTQEKFLLGKTSWQIESALGLRKYELRSFCYVYSLARVPTPDEVEFRLTCAFPAGEVFDDTPRKTADNKPAPSLMAAAHTERTKFSERRGRDEKNLYKKSYTPICNYYPPGSPQVLQWELTKPVPLGVLIAMVTTTIPFSKW